MDAEKKILRAIVANNACHARFLNTLSLMELCGAQKLSRLFKTLPAVDFLLEHVAEEYRHAFFLRRLANKLAPKTSRSFSNSDVFAKAQSVFYISHLDRRISLQLKSWPQKSPIRLAYLLTTAAIEQRALPFYQMYQCILDEAQAGFSLKSIISEEENHLSFILQQITEEQLPKNLLETCYWLEQDLFLAWMNAVAAEIHAHDHASSRLELVNIN